MKASLGSITSVCFSDDGSKIMATSKDGIIRIYDSSKNFHFSSLKGHTSHVNSSIFVDNNIALSGSHDKTMKFWDLNELKCTKTVLTGSSCNSMDKITDSVIISAHFDKKLRFTDTRIQQHVDEIETTHYESITSVDVSFDRNYIVTNSRDNTLKVFDCRTNKELTTLSHPKLCCSSDNLTKAYFKPFSNNSICVPSNVNSFIENSSNGLFIFNINNNSSEHLDHKSRVNDVALTSSYIVSATTEGNFEVYKQVQ